MVIINGYYMVNILVIIWLILTVIINGYYMVNILLIMVNINGYD